MAVTVTPLGLRPWDLGDTERVPPVKRLIAYSMLGYAAEVAISAAHDVWRRKPVRLRTSPLMLPIYALLLPFYEPLHDTVRRRSWPARATAYGMGFLIVEFATGAGYRALLGEAPWDYSEARLNVSGLVRPDYFFQWAALGLALEPLHDHLTSAEW